MFKKERLIARDYAKKKRIRNANIQIKELIFLLNYYWNFLQLSS